MSHLVRCALILVLLIATPDGAQGGPLCADTTVFPVSITEVVSCVVDGEQDSLPNVQAGLDQALSNPIVLDGNGSFCPGPACSGSEFLSSEPSNDFVIDPSNLTGNTSFSFEQIPSGTLFITLKQQNGFEIFRVPGPVQFDLAHQLGGEDTSHISTFVPEPTTSLLLLAGLAGLTAAGRKRSHH